MKGKNKIKDKVERIKGNKWVRNITEFSEGIKNEHIGAFAGQSAYFIFLSIFPLLSLMLMLAPILPFTQGQLVDFLVQIFPEDFSSFIRGIIDEIYSSGTPVLTIVSLVAGLWSASKGVLAIRNGLNEVFHTRETRNFLIAKLIGVLYTAVLVILIIALAAFELFGRQLMEWLVEQFAELKPLMDLLMQISGVLTFGLALLLILMMYAILPSGKRQSLIFQIPGAVFSAAAWVLIAWGFSYYISYSMKQSYMYGSLFTIILLLFWVYLMVNILFWGAQLNQFLMEYVYPERVAKRRAARDAKLEKRKAARKAWMNRRLERWRKKDSAEPADETEETAEGKNGTEETAERKDGTKEGDKK